MQRVTTWLAATLLLASSALNSGSVYAAPKAAPPVGSIQKITSDEKAGITEYRLEPNGLQILLAERHHTPIVTVEVVYHVGSRNEAVGYTGATHFLEHMMFRGTKEHDPRKGTGIDDVLKPLGGINNATTYYDRTNYYDIAAAQYLPTLLELEADRMRHALLRQEDQKSEMTVVRNELERNEDDPGRLLDWNLFAHSYLAHPYHHPVIGWRSDVENVPISRLRAFYDEFYYPNNSTLVVIGDFKEKDALQQIQKYFASVPASKNPFPSVYTSEPAQEGQRRFTVRRGQDLPKVLLGFHTPNARAEDTYALEVAASILGDERKQSSRLYQALIDSGLASDTYAYNYSLRDPAMFTMLATATPKTPSEKLEKILMDQAQGLATSPPTEAELEKAKNSIWKRMKLEAADPVGMSSQLAEAIAVADWKWWVNMEKNIKAVTAADVQRVAAKYFKEQNETVGYYYPVKAPDGATPPPAEQPGATSSMLAVPAEFVAVAASAAKTKKSATTPIKVVETTSAVAPAAIAPQVKKQTLSNGMRVLVLPVPGSGVVSIAGKVKAGDYFHPTDLFAVPDYVSDMLDKGSEHYSKKALAENLELMGSSLDFNSSNFWMSFQSQVVSADFAKYMNMLGDTLQHPLFSQEELDKQRKQRAADITQAMADTDEVSTNTYYNAVYKPNCVYYQQKFSDQLKDNDKITRDMLVAFHKAHVTPANTVLAIVGDIDPAKAFEIANKEFGSWTGGPADKIDVSDCSVSDVKPHTIVNQIPDKTNIDVLMGTPAHVELTSPDFSAAQVANAALGHDTISSRLAEVRNKYGYTYGISSFFSENAFSNGSWLIDFSVNPTNLPKALPVVRQIVTDYVSKGITPQELSDEAKRLSGEYVVERMRTPRQLADAITKYEIIGVGPKFMDEFPGMLRSVTVDQANAAIKKYFNLDKMVTSISGSVPADVK